MDYTTFAAGVTSGGSVGNCRAKEAIVADSWKEIHELFSHRYRDDYGQKIMELQSYVQEVVDAQARVADCGVQLSPYVNVMKQILEIRRRRGL